MVRATFDPGAKVRRIESKLESPATALRQIGALMVSESQRAFKAQAFGGKRWPPRSDVNLFGVLQDFALGRKKPPERRFQTRPALRDTGRLAQSIAFQLIGDSIVEVGTTVEYASVHQFGGQTKSVPITEALRKGLWSWLKRQGRELQRRIGWVLNRKFLGERLIGRVPKRPFVGITQTTRQNVRRAVGVEILEVR